MAMMMIYNVVFAELQARCHCSISSWLKTKAGKPICENERATDVQQITWQSTYIHNNGYMVQGRSSAYDEVMIAS